MDKFTPKHLIFLILGVSIVSLKTYPRTFILDGKRDSWIAVIISSIIIFLFLIYIMKVWKQSKEKSIVHIYKHALGEKLGNFFILLFTITLFITLVECGAVEADSMHENMLLETPKWYFALFFIVPSIYVLRKNIVAIITITIIGIIFIMLAGINLGILTTSYKDPRMLLPILEDGITIGFIKAVFETLGLYGCVSIVLPYMSFIEDKKDQLIRNVLISLIILVQMEIVSTSGILMTFSPDRAISLNYPKLLQTQLVSYFQFLDFGELYVMLQIIGGWLLKYTISFYGILIILRDYNVSKKQLNYFTYLLSAVVYVCVFFACKNSFILFELLNIYQYICLLNFVLIPLLVFVITHIKIKLKAHPKEEKGSPERKGLFDI